MPTSLSWSEVTAIENRFAGEKHAAQSEKTRLESQLSGQAAAVRQKYAAVRQVISDEERNLRNGTAAGIRRVQSEHDSEVASLDRQIVETRQQSAAEVNDLSEKIRVAQKKVFALQWQCTKQTEQKRKFASLRFRDYLKSVIWGS